MRDLYQAFAEARKLNKERGFTLIELLVVIAIIAILAAIAIPQFAKYRMRAFNSAAESDLRNLATAEEALYADFQIYGSSENAALNALTGTCGNGAVLTGPLNGATQTVAGAAVAGTRPTDGLVTGVGFGVSANVDIVANTDGNCSTYVAAAHHNNGNTEFAKDADSTAIYICRDDSYVGDAAGALPVTPPAPTPDNDDLNGVACGGLVGWVVQ
ncbi:prepilin-type N-terminal cleavage/methylation domain-containing protein [Hydrogenivirga sp.]